MLLVHSGNGADVWPSFCSDVERQSVCRRLLSHQLGSQPVDTFGLAGDAEISESG
jgi:hypothetical protein